MTKKDYQAIAGALYAVKRDENGDAATLAAVRSALGDILASDNPRFDRATFILACEDGNVNRRPKRVRRT